MSERDKAQMFLLTAGMLSMLCGGLICDATSYDTTGIITIILGALFLAAGAQIKDS